MEKIVSLGCDDDSQSAIDEEIAAILNQDDDWFDCRQEAIDSEIAAVLNQEHELFCEPYEAIFSPNNEMFESCQEEMNSEDTITMVVSHCPKARQEGGNPFFKVTREKLGRPRSLQNNTVFQDRLKLQLQQNREPNDDLFGEAISEAFFQSTRDYVQEKNLNPAHYSMQMKIHHNTRTHIWTSSPFMPLNDWVNDKQRTRDWLEKLAKELNSAEDLDATGGQFFVKLTFVRNFTQGGKCKKYGIKLMSFEAMLQKKKAVIPIKNRDELCCARAIVTIKFWFFTLQ